MKEFEYDREKLVLKLSSTEEYIAQKACYYSKRVGIECTFPQGHALTNKKQGLKPSLNFKSHAAFLQFYEPFLSIV